MSWDLYHSESERFASAAEIESKQGNNDRAVELYRLAAEAEARALNEVDPKKARTLGVTAVSVAALYYKAGDPEAARSTAQRCLSNDSLPDFASEQLKNILQQIDDDLANKPALLNSNGEHSSVKTIIANEESLISKTIGQEKVSNLNRFLWFCGGAEASILSRPECAIERSKYIGLGIATLSSTILAALSVGYAAMLAFKSVTMAVVAAVLCGVIIFNINRYIYSFSKDGQSIRRQLSLILPRLLITILISFVIAKPITLKLFENEISGQIEKSRVAENRQMYDAVSVSYGEISRLESENDSLRRELEGIVRRRDQLQTQLLAEATGISRGSTTGVQGEGPVYKILKSQLDQVTTELEQERARIIPRIEDNNKRISQLRQSRDEDIARYQTSYSPGLLAHIQALGQLSQNNSVVAVADWSITLLFILFGIAPLLMQLLSEQGPYRYILKRIEREVMLREEREILNLEMQVYIDSEVNREIKMMMLGTALHTDEVLDITSIRAEFTPKLASEMHRRLKERLEGLENIPSSKEEIPSTDVTSSGA